MVYAFKLIIYILTVLGGVNSLALDGRKFSIVTGANGYLGREIVHNLLNCDSSSSVVCLVREKRVEEEIRYWDSVVARNNQAGSPSVKVMPYDMLDGGKTLSDALEHVLDGPNGGDGDNGVSECCVYHVASVFTKVDDHRQMALDNVKGAEDVIKTVALFPSRTTRVVLTSSMAAVRGTGQIPLNGKWYTHEDWNNVSELGKDWGSSYQWSKAQSEKRSLELALEHSVPFIALCPSFVFGPPASTSHTSSSHSLTLVRSWILGQSPVQSRLCADVRDVARAHVLAGTSRNLSTTRILLSGEARLGAREVAEELKRIAKETGLGDADGIVWDKEFDGGAVRIGEKEVECVERAKDLLGSGFELRSVEDTFRDMALALLEMER